MFELIEALLDSLLLNNKANQKIHSHLATDMFRIYTSIHARWAKIGNSKDW